MKGENKDIKEKIAFSSQKNIKISARKMSLLANAVRGEDVSYAVEYLSKSDKKGAKLLLGLVQSALSNLGITENVVLYDVMVGPGMTMKRMRPVSKSRGHRILKRSSNVKVYVKEKSLDSSAEKTRSKK